MVRETVPIDISQQSECNVKVSPRRSPWPSVPRLRTSFLWASARGYQRSLTISSSFVLTAGQWVCNLKDEAQRNLETNLNRFWASSWWIHSPAAEWIHSWCWVLSCRWRMRSGKRNSGTYQRLLSLLFSFTFPSLSFSPLVTAHGWEQALNDF